MKTKKVNEITSTEIDLYMDELSRINELYLEIKYSCWSLPDEIIEQAWYNNLSFHFNDNGEFIFADLHAINGYTCLQRSLVNAPTLESLWACADMAKEAQLKFIGDIAYGIIGEQPSENSKI